MAVGDRVCLERREARGTPLRPGSVLRVDRGEYGFEVVVDRADDGLMYGVVRGLWGRVPCA